MAIIARNLERRMCREKSEKAIKERENCRLARLEEKWRRPCGGAICEDCYFLDAKHSQCESCQEHDTGMTKYHFGLSYHDLRRAVHELSLMCMYLEYK